MIRGRPLLLESGGSGPAAICQAVDESWVGSLGVLSWGRQRPYQRVDRVFSPEPAVRRSHASLAVRWPGTAAQWAVSARIRPSRSSSLR